SPISGIEKSPQTVAGIAQFDNLIYNRSSQNPYFFVTKFTNPDGTAILPVNSKEFHILPAQMVLQPITATFSPVNLTLPFVTTVATNRGYVNIFTPFQQAQNTANPGNPNQITVQAMDVDGPATDWNGPGGPKGTANGAVDLTLFSMDTAGNQTPQQW